MPILVERLRHAAPNQFPTYAEDIAPVLTAEARPGVLAVLKERIGRGQAIGLGAAAVAVSLVALG